jgi:hypothetical protein
MLPHRSSIATNRIMMTGTTDTGYHRESSPPPVLSRLNEAGARCHDPATLDPVAEDGLKGPLAKRLGWRVENYSNALHRWRKSENPFRQPLSVAVQHDAPDRCNWRLPLRGRSLATAFSRLHPIRAEPGIGEDPRCALKAAGAGPRAVLLRARDPSMRSAQNRANPRWPRIG